MVSMPTINMMDFGGGVTAGNCYAQPNETVIHIPSYEVHYKAPIQQQLSTCLVCKKTICLNAEATVDVYNSYTTNTKMIIAECLNRLVLASNTHAIPFNNPTICMNCYAQIDRLDALHNEFNLLKNCLREKMAEYIIKQIPEREESSPDPPQNVTMEQDLDLMEYQVSKSTKKRKKCSRYMYTEIHIPGQVLFPSKHEKQYVCFFCYKKFNKKESIIEHFDLAHGKHSKIECRICKKDIKGGIKEFMVHMSESHSLNEAREVIGRMKVKDVPLLRRTKRGSKFNKKTNEDLNKFRKLYCTKCKITMPDNLLETHIKKYHRVKNYVKCPKCLKDIQSETIKLHMLEKHNIGIPFSCQHCSEQFNKRHRYKYHLLRVHGSPNMKKYPCSNCSKTFFRQQEVKVHNRLVHENVRSHVCSVCDATFKMRGTLNIHMRKHTGIKPYVCKICMKAFDRLNSCKTHIRNVHKVEISKRFNHNCPDPEIPIKFVDENLPLQ